MKPELQAQTDVPASGEARPELILLVPETSACRGRIEEISKTVGANFQLGSNLPKPSPRTVAIIELEQSPMAGSKELQVIDDLRKRGAVVFVFAKGAQQWELSARCRVFIAGAERLFDANDSTFTDELEAVLRAAVKRIVGMAAEESEIQDTLRRLGIVVASRRMLALFRLVLRFSRLSDLPVLITGETGTGKESVARALHQLDTRRAKGPFVPVNCGALTATLAESELFGHRRGAFTGADRDRRGLIRAANGGVLFLDEVGELPDPVQTKLLRVLQEGCVLPVGEEREERVDIRVVAATNRDLVRRAAESAFRSDLLHRLNVLPIPIPPLRERRDDIRPLVEHFLGKHAGAMQCQCPHLENEVVDALENMSLPGNIRQLENLVRQALANHAPQLSLRLSDLPGEVWDELSGNDGERTLPEGKSTLETQELEIEFRRQVDRLIEVQGGQLSRTLDFCERILVSITFERAHGNQSKMARMLHITPRSVYNKLRRHRLQKV